MKDDTRQPLDVVSDFLHPIEIQIIGRLSDIAFDNEIMKRPSAKLIQETFALCSKYFVFKSNDLPETPEGARRWAEGLVSLVSAQTFAYRVGVLHIGCGRIFSFTASPQDLTSTGASLTASLRIGKDLQEILPDDAANVPARMFQVRPFKRFAV